MVASVSPSAGVLAAQVVLPNRYAIDCSVISDVLLLEIVPLVLVIFFIALVVTAPVPFPIKALPDVKVVAPVPPFATGNVPVTPGLGLAAKTLAAVVDARFVNMDGDAVNPVPPCAIVSVPDVISAAACLCVKTASYVIYENLLDGVCSQ